MKKAFLVLFFMMGVAKVMACSMEVDQNYTKNILAAHAASYNELSLVNVSGLAIANYSLTYSTGEANGSCPDYIYTQAKITFNHSPTALKHCTYSVTVKASNYIGSETPDGPVQDVEFINSSVACSSTISGAKIPRKLPIRVGKPIIVRPLT